MARDQLEAFLKTVKGDPALLERFSTCPNLNAIAELGASMGYSFSGVELVQHQAEATLKLSDADLEAAAAGVELEGHLWLMQIVWG
jgi:predicted ribosomally synthesized peptide with nif11-like leader